MAYNYFLVLHLLAIIIPSIYSLHLYKPLSDSSCKEVKEIDERLSEPFLPTSYQAGSSTTALGGVKSILDTTKEVLKSLLNPHTSRQYKLSTSWEVCFDISTKALESSESPEVKSMAKAVMKLGSQFDRLDYNPQNKMDQIISTINLFYLALQNDSINMAERIWSVVVLSLLRLKIPEDKTPTIPGVWEAQDLGRPRGHFLLFFLQDKDLGKVIQEMWSDSHLEPSEHVIQEAIQRESIVHQIQRQMARFHPSKHFQTIYLAFINLESPIDSQEALSLIELIRDHLDRLETQNRNGFDEEKNTIRLLLHLEVHDQGSYLKYKELIKKPNFREKMLAVDASIQLEEKLPPSFSDLLKQIHTTKIVDTEQIKNALRYVVKDEQISTSQAGRCLRVLNLLYKSDTVSNAWLNNHLDKYPQIIPKLYEKLLKYRHGRMDPNWFVSRDLESMIFNKLFVLGSIEDEDQVAEKYRIDLANVLVSKGVLHKRCTTGPSPNESRLVKEYMNNVSLYWIFHRMLELKANSNADQDHNADYVIVEYILHVISFKNNDKKLYRHLLADKHVPEIFPLYYTLVFQKLSKTVFSFVYDQSWEHGGRIDIFTDAMKKLEKVILCLLYP
ncbi:uncharacterized protein MELLADRAFT_61423 [Melampsora larici-populina 98AG31]|uniref:Secreted protein n=1 Tax=Melampsora larici-populina (strain 98AG31 / pathotype 3-4-7) TaxID=747676 RepID=F4REU9_MELLP|nr:uncharacterized protein MELLADRAFT_61423 [Melampsora larici-populina 98AG31]EGG09219.1 hypothetical protein MELLADRAFT_61423 [Melampsora larici-populina 98AG31]